MYVHRIIQPLNGLHVQFDLPPEFADCQEAEIIVLPVKSAKSNPKSWEQWVRSVAGTLGDDFSDDIDDSDLGLENKFELSLLYQAVEEAGLIGCIETDEQLATTYKQKLDFSHKHGKATP